MKNFNQIQSLKSKLFVLLFIVLAFTGKAQVQLSLSASTDLASVNTGNQFIYTLNYQISSLTTNGTGVVATMPLPTNLTPFDVSNFNNSVAFDNSQVSSITYNSGTNTITINFVNPIPAGSTGQLQVKFRYTNGTTPNGYAPNLFTSIDASNNLNPDGSSGPVYSDTINVVAIASNKYTVSKTRNAGGAIDDVTIFKLSIGTSGASSAALRLYNPVLIDTLPVGCEFVEATSFSGSNNPVYDAYNRTITWTWTSSPLSTNYSSSAYVSVKYTSPNYSIGSSACNSATITGDVPVLPIGSFAGSNKSGSVCFNVQSPTPGAACSGGSITAATASWLSRHILANTSCNTFKNGWYNSGNTELDSVYLTYLIDKSIDMNVIKIRPVIDGLGRYSQAKIVVSYATNTTSNVYAGTYYSLSVAALSGQTQNINVTLPSGQYITQVNFAVTGALPIGGSQDLSYCGDARTAAMGAKDGSPIVEGITYNTSNVGDDGTVVRNQSNGSYFYLGTPANYSNCNGSAEIMIPQPVFGFTGKSITSSSSLRASDTINYRFSTYLGGNVNATNVVVTDTLDSRLSYVPASSIFFINSTGTPITPTVNGNVLVWNLGTLVTGKDYAINFSAVIAPGTAPSTIPNRINLNSNNALFNGNTSTVNTTVISAVALRAFKGQSGCNPDFVYYPTNAIAQEAGAVNYKITVKNLGNVAAKDLVLVDVFPFIGDIRGSQWFANLVGPVVISDPSSTVYYTTTNNPCFSDFSPATNPGGCSNPVWTITPPVDITQVKAIKIVRSAVLPALDSIVMSWPMRAPVGTPINKLMNNSIMYQVRRADNNSQLLPTTPIMVGMFTTCTPVLGSIGNYAWIDNNKNGIQDEASSLGLNGVKVYLYGAGTDQLIGGGDDILLDSSVTANDFFGNPGYYKFIEVPSGKYYVKFQTNYNQYRISPVINQTIKTDINSDADTTTGNSGLVTIIASGSGQDKDNTTIDAGFYPTGSLGNYVWWDENRNGLQDEPASNGINGEWVYLYKEISSVYTKIDSMLTGNDPSGNPGAYNFEITSSGNYKVQFPVSIGTKNLTSANTSAGVNGNSDANTSTGFSNVIVMNLMGSGVAKNNPTIDAGYYYSGTLGNYVWYDVNENGLQDEPASNGINGVKVYLYKDNGSGFVLIDSTTTATLSGNPGYYNFDIYTSGDYKVKFPLMVSTKIGTSQNGTAGVNGNSDFDTLTGFSPVITMNLEIAGITKDNPTIDAGYVCNTVTPTITGNGLLCPGEFGTYTSSPNAYYQWYKDGVLIPSATNQTYSTNLPSVYTVKTQDIGLCYSDLSNSITVSNNVAPTANFTINDTTQCLGSNEFYYTNTSTSGQTVQSIWNNSVVGGTPSTVDTMNVEVGVKFRSNIHGKIKGIKFFKLAVATGPFVGKLYTSGGVLLASATFTSVSGSGWQTVEFSSPINIDANTTYVASYYAPKGNYAFDEYFFNASGVTNGNLTALQFGVDGSNGLFSYAPGGGFPSNSYHAANYWVDVLFESGLSYNWNLGNSSTTTVENPYLSYNSTGTKTVSLTVTNQFGCSDTKTKQVVVRPGPIAAFTVTANDCEGNFTLSNQSLYADYYEWGIVNDDTTYGKYLCTSSNPDYHVYLIPGTYRIRLIARSNGECTDTTYQNLTVYPKPVALIGKQINACGFNANFTSYSYYTNNVIWNFGDVASGVNNTSTANSANHVFSAPGTYTVKLIAFNAHGCSDTTTTSVTINPAAGIVPTASFTSNLVTGSCVTKLYLTNTSTNAVSYSWIMPDGSFNNQTNPSVSLATAGNYTIKLVAISSTGCTDTISQIVNVAADSYGAVASFTAPDSIQCLQGNSFNFMNYSAYYGFGWNNRYEWDFGDGTTNNSVTFAFNKQYANPGTYLVRLIAKSSTGCADTAYNTVVVKESAISNITVTTGCSMTAHIENNSTNNIGNIWTFGEGDLSSTDSAEFDHQYHQTGYYFIHHIAVANNGCHDSSNVGAWAIRGTTPTASFSWDTVSCSNGIRFTNLSQNAGGYFWNFGDGSAVSEDRSPVHAYASAGTYPVTLVAHSGPGCSASTTILVNAPQGWNIALPKASFTYTIEACTNNITLTSTSTDANSYTWKLNGVAVASGSNVVIPNPGIGFHTISLVALNGSCTDVNSKVIQIMNAPIANFNFQVSSCSGNAVFVNTSKNGLQYFWNFGDNSTLADTSVTSNSVYTYASNGTFEATLIVANNAGCRDTITKTVTVNVVANNSTANFTFNSTYCNCTCSNKVQFLNTSSGTGNKYFWSFGDGNTSTQENPYKGFAAGGTYLVTLTTINSSGCSNSITKSVFVPSTGNGPSAGFSTDHPVQCVSTNNFNFYNHSNFMGNGWIKKNYWNFGDGTSDSINSFVFNKKYNNPGTYTVTLVTVGAEGCRDTATMEVVVEATPCYNSVMVALGKDPFSQGKINSIETFTATGTSEVANNTKEMILYPNPSNGAFTISTTNVFGKKISVRVINVLGQEVLVENFSFSAEGKYAIESSTMAEGKYMVMIYADNELAGKESLVVIK